MCKQAEHADLRKGIAQCMVLMLCQVLMIPTQCPCVLLAHQTGPSVGCMQARCQLHGEQTAISDASLVVSVHC